MGKTRRLLAWAAALSFLASVAHGLMTEVHFAEWWGYGAFFAFATAAQALYGAVIVGTPMMHGESIDERWPRAARRWFYLAGIAGNLALVAMYLVSRTVGIPFFGPEAGEVEPWSLVGNATKVLELALVAILALLAREAWPLRVR